ncbi:AlpA family transcriptional regulator [Bradyrhizobium sp. CSS354]|uniref:helix-turn-helix transcriptional regulator n=1 Tax=Bradyrhizobium sp. CSS354 TaxID=2699172 RepID=UPI0023AF8CEB|nr:helix-turn-helix domain-containing protein [Bradyrhizobium sp. CSS354]MDE5466048.1 helix-turn-helix domain-containing protein [Bradyrhizobium sp. CSS354]
MRRLAAAGALNVTSLSEALLNLLTLDEMTAATGLSRSTLAKRRCDGTGPAFFKIGRQVKYDRADVDAWMLSRRRTSTWTANDNTGKAVTA